MITQELKATLAELQDWLSRAMAALDHADDEDASPTVDPTLPVPPAQAATDGAAPPQLSDELYAALVERLRSEAPEIIRLMVEQPEIELHVRRPVRIVDGDSTRGRVVYLIAEGFLDQPKTNNDIVMELARTGRPVNSGTVHTLVRQLVAERILELEAAESGKRPLYRSTGLKVTAVDTTDSAEISH